MFTIWIDENGYYSTEDKGIFAEVKEMPVVEHPKHLLAYKYNSDTQLLELDEAKLKEIKEAIKNEARKPSDAERLADLENAFLEFTSMMLSTNGGV
jgi:hypothetical protein